MLKSSACSSLTHTYLLGCLLFDYSTKRYFISEKHTRVQTNKFYGCHSYFEEEIDVRSGFNVENKNESRKKWRPFYFILFRK
jgi:hypothetical protein